MTHPKIVTALSDLETDAKQVLKQAERMLCASDRNLFPFDLLVMGIVKRTLALSDGFCRLIQNQNIICAGALLRMHLDTALRLSAGFIVNNPHDFANEVMDGTYICKMKDKDGNRMHDGYLVKLLSREYPWVKSIYNQASSFVHFSDIHIFSTADPKHNTNGPIHRISIQPKDSITSDKDYLDAILVFHNITCIIVPYIEGWIVTKTNSSTDS